MIIEYKGKKPIIGSNVFIATTAVVIGDVEIMDGASIWYGTVLRGDMAAIKIGKESNIQDNCTVHTDYGSPAIIGDRVSVGHNAVVHGCTIENESLIGINAVVLTGAIIKKGSVVAAGSVIKEGQQVGPYHLVAGSPAVLKKELSAALAERFRQPIKNYRKLADEHMALIKTEC